MGDNTEMGALAVTEELHAKQQEAARKEAERAARKAPQDAAADAKAKPGRGGRRGPWISSRCGMRGPCGGSEWSTASRLQVPSTVAISSGGHHASHCRPHPPDCRPRWRDSDPDCATVVETTSSLSTLLW
jgi:hypothetical protein